MLTIQSWQEGQDDQNDKGHKPLDHISNSSLWTGCRLLSDPVEHQVVPDNDGWHVSPFCCCTMYMYNTSSIFLQSLIHVGSTYCWCQAPRSPLSAPQPPFPALPPKTTKIFPMLEIWLCVVLLLRVSLTAISKQFNPDENCWWSLLGWSSPPRSSLPSQHLIFCSQTWQWSH